MDRAHNILKSANIPETRISSLIDSLNSTNCYYAVQYEDLGNGYYDNISFYLIDPSLRRLHKVTNTSSFKKNANGGISEKR